MLSFSFGLPIIQQFPNLVPSTAEPPKQIKRMNLENKESEQESFQPDYHHLKKLGLKVNKNKIQTGGWSALENQIYLKFMMENFNDFLSQKARRTSKVFYRLSKILKRRTPDQCRSHHQKLQLKYQDDLNGIMQEVLRKIQRTIAQDYVNEHHRVNLQSFLCLKETMKTKLKNHQNSGLDIKNMQKFEWYGIDTTDKVTRISLKTESIKEWSCS